MSLCNVTFLEEKKRRPTSQTFPFDIIRAMYSRRATVSPNSIRVCPKRNALSESDNSVPVNVGITFDPAFSGWWGYKRASCICRWENALHGRWDMSQRKPIREFPTAAWKTTFTKRIALHIATDIWKRAGLAESMYQKARIYYYLPRGTIRCPISIHTVHRVFSQSQIL